MASLQAEPQRGPALLRLLPRVAAHLFFLFFTSPVLSPYIGGKTLYLFWLVPVFDPYFFASALQRIRASDTSQRFWTGALLIWFACVAPEFALRWGLTLWTLAYLIYAAHRNIFHLKFWMGINVAVAIAQAVTFLALGSDAALKIGPTAIAEFVWGQYATETFTNFYSIIPSLALPRFSGLSREGGFFAALLVATAILNIVRGQRIGFLLWLGLILSLSKATVFFPLAWLIVCCRRYFGEYSAFSSLAPVLVFCLLFGLLFSDGLLAGGWSDTFTHRFFLFSALAVDADLATLMVGNAFSPTDFWHYQAFGACAEQLMRAACEDMPSFASLILAGGLFGLLLYLGQLSSLGIGFWGVALVFCMTSNVSPLSSTSFAVLAYLAAIWLSTPQAVSVDSGRDERGD